MLTRYDDIVATFKDVQHFSNEGRLARAVEYLPTEQRAGLNAFENHYRTKGLLHSDPPDHTRLRGLVTKAFTPRVVEKMRSRIQALVDEMLDAVQKAGQADLIHDLASPLPAIVIAEVFGVPLNERHLFKNWADDLLAFQGINRPDIAILEQAQKSLLELRSYLAELVAQRKREPKEDLLSQLVAAESQGDRLSEAELMNTSVTLLVAGHETTTSLVGNGLFTLLKHPDQLEQLRRDPALLPATLEEILRFESPVSRQPRLIRGEVIVRGEVMREGQVAFQMLNAANRDPLVFNEPDKFDIKRKDNRHIAFGHGIHFCIGAMLARTEGNIAISSVLKRFPDLRLHEERPAQWDIAKLNSRMLKTLPVQF